MGGLLVTLYKYIYNIYKEVMDQKYFFNFFIVTKYERLDVILYYFAGLK